jgi:DNA-directed RNA polymerase subunit RPC12/RpoP
MKRLTPEYFRKNFEEKFNGEYELIDEYINMRTKITVKHIYCGNTFPILPYNIVTNNQGCPNCRYKKSSKSLIQEAAERTLCKLNKICESEGYKIIGEYKGYEEKIAIKHIDCDNIYNVTPSSFINRGTRCPKCSRKNLYKRRRKTPEQYLKEFNIATNGEYKLLTPYKNKRTKVLVKHLKCNHEFPVLPLSITQDNTGCPKCNESKGEKEIRKFLSLYNVKYIEQYKFENCKNKRSLPFDFAIFNNDNTLKCLIEYQGIQHYKKTGYFKGIEKLKYTKQNDQIKRDYCNKNNILLIEIPYTKFDFIKKILIQNKIINA